MQNSYDDTAPGGACAPLEIDPVQGIEFLRLISQNPSEPFAFFAYPEGKDSTRPTASIRPAYGTVTTKMGWMKEKQDDGKGIWVNFQQVSQAGTSTIRCVVAELNFEPPKDELRPQDGGYWPLPFSAKIKTAPNDFHYIWIVDTAEGGEGPLTEPEYQSIAQRLQKQYRALKDSAQPNRPRRLPGTINRKPGLAFPFLVELTGDTGRRYAKSDLLMAFPGLSPEEAANFDASVPLYGDGNVSRYFDAIKSIDPKANNNLEIVGKALYHEGAGGTKAQLMFLKWAGEELEDRARAAWPTFAKQDPDNPITGANINLFAVSSTDTTSGQLKREIPNYDEKDDKPRKSLENLQKYLAARQVTFRFNRFAHRVEIVEYDRVLPVEDSTLRRLRIEAEMQKLIFGIEEFKEKCLYLAEQNTCNPALEYINSVDWDGKSRLDRWLIDICGAEDNELNRAIGRKWWIGLIRRVRHPGCKFDVALILKGEQGLGKSGVFKIIASPPWFSDSLHIGADPKRAAEHTAGKMILESAELVSMAPKQMENNKAFLSRTTDRARLSYETMDRDFDRQWVMVGTSNRDDLFSDTTGNRRFWLVETRGVIQTPEGPRFDFAKLKQMRDQLFAEAAVGEAKGESLELPSHLYKAAEAVTERYQHIDPFLEEIEAGIGDNFGIIWLTDLFQHLGIQVSLKQPWMSKRITGLMLKKGFKKDRKRKPGDANPTACFVKAGPNDDTINLPHIIFSPTQPVHEDPMGVVIPLPGKGAAA